MNRYNTHPIIAREGWPIITIGLILSIICTIYIPYAAIVLWIFTLFALQFFRDPKRYVPTAVDPYTVLSAVDGRVIRIESVRDEYAQRDALKISVFMNVFNVHSNRVPVDGTVQTVEYFPGSFFNAALDKASLQNERNAVVVQTPTGHTVTYVQIAGLVARRILCYIKPGDELKKGERYGFIRFGSRVDIYLPNGSEPCVTIGQKVSATTTILARLPHDHEA